MNLGLKIGIGAIVVGGAAAAGAYMWAGSKSTLDSLLQAIPHDTVGVVAMQGIPDVLQDYHIINADFSPAFFSSEQWQEMQKSMDLQVDPKEFLLNAKLNPLGISAFTGSADFSTEQPKSFCGAYYLPSLSAVDSAAYFKTFIDEQMKKMGMPMEIESVDGVYSIMSVSWVAHSDWVVISSCEEGDAKDYLKTLSQSKNGYGKEEAGSLLADLSSGDWQVVGTVNLNPLQGQMETLAQLDPDIEQVLETIDLKAYQSIGFKGFMGTGSMNMDMAVRFSSSDAPPMNALAKIDTKKMIEQLPGSPILVAQQGFNLQTQIDLMLKMDPAVASQYEEAKTEFTNAMGMDLETDLIKKIGNQAGIAVVHDDFIAGAHIWLELESGHKFKELAEKALAEMGDMAMLNKDEKEDALFLQTPPSMAQMMGLPDVSLTIGITPNEILMSAGKSTPNAVKDLGKNSIASQMDSSLKSDIQSSSYGAAVLDFDSARKLLSNEMVKQALDGEMSDDERKMFDSVVSSMKSISVTSDIDGRTITTSMAFKGTNDSAFSDIIKNTVIPELKNSF
jgi:hypothetical protein